MKIDYRMQYYDVITNPRWPTAANINIVMSSYVCEKWTDYDEIWYVGSDSDHDKNNEMILPKFKIQDRRQMLFWKARLWP